MKTQMEEQKTEEMTYGMGTGGGPSRMFQSDPSNAQVEIILIDDSLDNDLRHVTSTHPICASPPIPTHTYTSIPPNHPLPSSSTILERHPSFAEPATDSTTAPEKINQPRKKARTVPKVTEEGVKERVKIMREEPLQQLEEHKSNMKQFSEELQRLVDIAAQQLLRARAERSLAEERLKHFPKESWTFLRRPQQIINASPNFAELANMKLQVESLKKRHLEEEHEMMMTHQKAANDLKLKVLQVELLIKGKELQLRKLDIILKKNKIKNQH